MSTDLTAEGGHGAVPTGPGVPVGAPSAPRREWPLYEVFVRGKRGLNHVHVGSLHAPDDEMAVHAARDDNAWVTEAATAYAAKHEGAVA